MGRPWRIAAWLGLAAAAPLLAAVVRPLPRSTPRVALESPVLLPVAANPDLLLPLPPPPACDGGARGVGEAARRISRSLAAQRILYNSEELSDCSGMAHRVLDQLADRCDGVGKPEVTEARSARAIAAWYAQRGRLVTIDHPLDADDALVPGAVVFFGRPGQDDVSLDQIYHIGVVVSIERDAVGRVLSYRMFHGRRPGRSASITRWHKRDADPPLGNGRERLVAVAWPSGEQVPAGMHAVADAAGPWTERALR